jgi:hypothetical protein
MEKTLAVIKEAYSCFSPFLNERLKRQVLGSFASAIGHGGIVAMANIAGVDRQTVANGKKEMQSVGDEVEPNETDATDSIELLPKNKIRRKGGGRKKITSKDEKILDVLKSLVEPYTKGDPMSPLLWTSKSCRNLADALTAKGHKISHLTVAELLHELGYSLQANIKTLEGSSQHPDRDAQFEFISNRAEIFQIFNQPVISVDTKKKELVGLFRNNGREIRPKGHPEKVNVHDFIDEEYRSSHEHSGPFSPP